jgi:hypothetical protein
MTSTHTPTIARTPDAPFDTACWITLRWTRGTRFYRAHLEQDLWAGGSSRE